MKTFFSTSAVASLTIAAALFFGASAHAASHHADTPAAASARENIKTSTSAAMNRPMTVTSEFRDDSAAHRRGAIDISSKDLTSAQRHAEAKTISNSPGLKNHQVIVEEVHTTKYGPNAQANTTYQNGVQGNTRWGEVKASATHTHIQPPAAPNKK